MLKIANALGSPGSAPRTPATPAPPPIPGSGGGTLLSLAWINGQVSGISFQRGVRVASHVYPETTEDLAGFFLAVKAIVDRTGYAGSHATLILSHSRLTQRFLEVPNRQGKPFQRALQRQVDQSKSFPGLARWVAQETIPTKSASGMLLHILPRALLTDIGNAVHRAGPTLVCAVPASEAMRGLVQQVPAEDQDILLFASALRDATLLLLVRGDGTPLLVRSSSDTWERDPARVAVDLHRTVLFVQEQFARSVSQIWLQGPGCAKAAEAMAAQLAVPIQPVPGNPDPLFWAQAGATLGPKHPLNLVTREQKEAGSRRVLFRLSLATAALMVLLALAFSGYAERIFRRESEELRRLLQEEERLLRRHAELQKVHESLGGQESFLQQVGANRQAPVHVWLLGYLSEATPQELMMTNLWVKARTNGWEFLIQGQAQPALARQEGSALQLSLSRFTNALAAAPFHLSLQESEPGTRLTATPAATNAPAGWAGRVRSALRRTRPPDSPRFSFTGHLP